MQENQTTEISSLCKSLNSSTPTKPHLKYKFRETKFHPDQHRLTPQNISRIPTSKDISQTLSRVLLFTQSLNKTKQCSSSWSLVQRKKENTQTHTHTNTQTQDQFIQYLLPSLRSQLVSHDSFHTPTNQPPPPPSRCTQPHKH
jgi:hypothetical protein